MNTTNPREAYGQTLVELGREDPRIVVLEADLGKSTRSCLFKDAFPERYFEMGIAEQNMTSTAAGLALVGKIPFLSTFAVFATGRAYDQIRNVVCIPRLRVRICGSSCGLSDFGDGKTHQSVEDVALMRAVPNMTVLVPVDAVETRAMMRALVDHPGPAYLRINRNDLPVYTPEGAPYAIGQAPTLREGSDVVVFANGVMVSRAMAAAEALQAEGVSLKVVNVSTPKPLDVEALRRAVASVRGGVVIAEEHTGIGGLAGAILEALGGELRVPCETVAIRDSFGTSARGYDEILAHYGLTPAAVAAAARKVLGGR
jgi:transketolase